MSSLSFNINGLTAALQKIDAIGTEAADTAGKELKAFAAGTVADAQSYCPVDLGYLRSQIQYSIGSALEIFINVNAFYAAYVEFGTGANAFVSEFIYSPEMKEYAARFYVNGKGHMPAKPFLFPAYEKNRLELIVRLKGYGVVIEESPQAPQLYTPAYSKGRAKSSN